MKNLNKISLTFVFVFWSLNAATDYIAVSSGININLPIQRPNLMLKPTNPLYLKIERELATLKASTNQTGAIKLNSDKAPELTSIISDIVSRLCSTVKIKAPTVQIYFFDQNDTYNAKAVTQSCLITETLTTRKHKSIEKQVKNYEVKDHCLQLGEGLLKLLFWNARGKDLLEGIIAHEIGHMIQKKFPEPKQNEYDADATAVKLLGPQKAQLLTKAIDMNVLGGHVYNILSGQADIFHLPIGYADQLVRVIVSSLIEEMPDLGDLGRSATHVKFGYVVDKVFKDSLQYSFNPKIGLTEDNFFKIYEKLQKACSNCSSFMQNEDEINHRCRVVESFSDQYYSPITHPTPLERRMHIQGCINKFC
jgi:hypothetical protein